MLPAGAPQAMYQAPQQQHSVVGPALLGAGAGLLGGVLLEEAIDRPMGGFGGGWGGGMGGGWGGNDDGNVSAHPAQSKIHTSIRAADALACCVTVPTRMHWSLHTQVLSKNADVCMQGWACRAAPSGACGHLLETLCSFQLWEPQLHHVWTGIAPR